MITGIQPGRGCPARRRAARNIHTELILHVRVVGPVHIRPGGVQVGFGPGGVQVSVGPGWASIRRAVPFGIVSGPSAGQFTSPFGRVVVGTVGSVSSSSFTITMGAGQTVTVDEQSSTAYRKAGSPVAASAVTRGARVAVLGSPGGSQLPAIVVAVLPG